MKKSKIIILIFIIIILILLGIIIKLKIKDNQKQDIISDAIKFKRDFEELNGAQTFSGETYNEVNIISNNPIKYVNLEELVNIINTEEAYIYISSPNCPYCRATIESLLEVANQLNINKIYYYDAFQDNYYSKENYENLMKQLQEKNIVRYTDDEKWQWGIPALLKVNKGKISFNISGIAYKLEEGQSKYDQLTEEQKALVYDRYYKVLSENIY